MAAKGDEGGSDPRRVALVCWNVAGRVTSFKAQFERVVALAPDVICLQEVRASTAGAWIDQLTKRGWSHALVAQPDSERPPRRRSLNVLTASRLSMTSTEIAGLAWSERALATKIDGIEIVNLHSPISTAPGLAKVRTHEAVHAHLASGTGPRVLCGDLNTPRREHPDGRVWTFARTQRGTLRPERGQRWDDAELALIRGLEPFGFRDAFREKHGLARRELSWKWPRWEGGYRLDHLIVSAEVHVAEVRYLHEWRTDGISDHSGLFALLSPADIPARSSAPAR